MDNQADSKEIVAEKRKVSRKKVITIVSLVVLFLMLIGAGIYRYANRFMVTDIGVDESDVLMEVGDHMALDFNIHTRRGNRDEILQYKENIGHPKMGEYKPIAKAENIKVVEISDEGIKAIAPGKTIIWIEYAGFKTSYMVAVAVKPLDIHISIEGKDIPDDANVEMGEMSISLIAGSNIPIKYEIEPTDATSPVWKFSSSSKSIFTVDKNGKISAVAPGVAELFVSADNIFGEKIEKEIKIKVRKQIDSDPTQEDSEGETTDRESNGLEGERTAMVTYLRGYPLMYARGE